MKRTLKIYFNAPITLTFAGICLISLILGIITNGYTTTAFFCTYSSSFLNPLTYVRLVGHVFGHSGYQHFINNILYILLLGPILEEKYGNKLILVILFTAITTGLIHNILEPRTALLGASGIVFAFILLASVTGNQNGIPVTLILVALLWIGGEIYNGFTSVDNVSQITHILGGICGAGMGMFFKK